MKNNTIDFNKVADIYDSYVNIDFDIPFFEKETKNCNSEILELMCGTGRVSIPLLQAGRKMTCVDYSNMMLEKFRQKIKNNEYPVNIILEDVTELNLGKKYRMIILPFHSFSEILSTDLQLKALQTISNHLENDGVFILTLQNPFTRLKTADGSIRFMGKFPLRKNSYVIISYQNHYIMSKKLVTGYQFYEMYNSDNIMTEKRVLEINFKPIFDADFREILKATNLKIIDLYGDYNYGKFEEDTSNFMVYKLTKR